MKIFLTLKHWQLFVLLVGVPIILQFVMMGSILAAKNAVILFPLFPIIMILYAGVFFGWFYSLGTNLYEKLPPTVTMNLTRFKIFLFIPIAYILLFCGFFFIAFTGRNFNPAIIFVILPLHLFSMFCIFYCLYFNAKTLKAVEWQKQVTFSDFVGEFFLIWFFPFGIWIIQPRINKLFDTTANEQPEL